MNRPRLLSLYSLLAGLSDFATGLMLLAVPTFTLRMMLIPAMPAEPIYMRWIGVFVFATGFYYLLPWRHRDPVVWRREMATVFLMTAAVRLAVAAFTTGAIAAGSLPWQWSAVAAFDAATGVFQAVALSKGWLDG